MVTLHRSPRSNLIVRTCFSFQGLRSTTTSRRGPRLGSWPLPAAAPVVSGNRWCWSFIRPSRRFFVHFWTTRKTALIFNHRIKSKDGKKNFKHASVIGDETPMIRDSNLCLNWSDCSDRRAVSGFKLFCQNRADHTNSDKVRSLSPCLYRKLWNVKTSTVFDG